MCRKKKCQNHYHKMDKDERQENDLSKINGEDFRGSLKIQLTQSLEV